MPGALELTVYNAVCLMAMVVMGALADTSGLQRQRSVRYSDVLTC
jgi:hypothetical protein